MDSSTILITGSDGQLGRALGSQYPEARAVRHEELDITNEQAICSFNWDRITVIINAAGYTDVDGAETPEGRAGAWQVNAIAVAHLAKVAADKDLTLVHVSTDYVFDGTKNPHTENEPLNPLSSYGASKAAGDIAAILCPKHYLVRSSWIIGDGKNFVRTMLDLGKKGVNPTVVVDQVGRPTFTSELAKAIDHLLQKQPEYGIYNMTNDGEPVSWADLARSVFKEASLSVPVTDTTTAEYFAGKSGVARRPLNSTFDLSKIKATGFIPKDWHEDLTDYISKYKQAPHLDDAQGASEE